jgi:hypothetical protein
MDRGIARENKYKQLFLYLVGIAFLISGINDWIRTYCLSLPENGLHPGLVHGCLIFTAPLAYLDGFALIVVGLVILFLNRIVDWLVS